MDIYDIQFSVLQFCLIEELVQTRQVSKSMKSFSDALIIEELAYSSRETQKFCGRNCSFIVYSSDDEYYYYDLFKVNWDFDEPVFKHCITYAIDDEENITTFVYKKKHWGWVSDDETVLEAVIDYLETNYHDFIISDLRSIKFAIQDNCKKYGLDKFTFEEKIMERVKQSLSELPESVYEGYINLQK